MMLTKFDLRNFKRNIKHIHSALIILQDAIENKIGKLEYEDIKDNLDFILSKVNATTELYKKLSIYLRDTEECIYVDLLLCKIESLLKVLKYSLKAKRTKVTVDDISNCIDIITEHTAQVIKYSYKIIFEFDNIDNILPIFSVDNNNQ